MRRQALSHSYGIACTSWPSGRGWRRARALPVAPRHVTTDERRIAMQMTSPDVSRRLTPGRSTAAIQQDGERSGMLPPGEPATAAGQFLPLDSGIVNEAIPAFFIGRNQEGFWVARDAKGQIGGIFLLENSALSFAKRHSRPGGCATIFPSHRFELDLENNGNPLALQLGSLMRLRRRAAAFVGKVTDALKRRLEDFHAL